MEIERAEFTIEPLAYGVWIRGQGWLKKGQRVFSDPRRELAVTAARMWGAGARVLPVDESLAELETELLERERVRALDKRSWIHGLFR